MTTIILAVGIINKMNYSKVMNPQALTSMYGEVPDFAGSEISEINFKRDEPRVSIKFLTQNNLEKVQPSGRRSTIRSALSYHL